MSNYLSDRKNWEQSWNSYVPSKIQNKHFIEKYLEGLDLNNKNVIEIGGFPGTMSAFFYKKYNANVFFVDFYINPSIVKSIEKINDIEEDTIKYIESDFFEFKTNEKFDLVYSSGFIEHFIDIKDVIQRHIDLLSSNGHLLILLPNFKGINGWIQKKFDRPSYDLHNIKSMDIHYLTQILKTFNLKNLKISFSDKPMLWLSKQNKCFNSILRFIIKLLGYFLKLFPFKSKYISPFIVITAQKY